MAVYKDVCLNIETEEIGECSECGVGLQGGDAVVCQSCHSQVASNLEIVKLMGEPNLESAKIKIIELMNMKKALIAALGIKPV